MDRTLPATLLALTLLLMACNREAPPPEATPSADDLAPASVDRNAASSVFPEEFVVSTNEPFWQARVGGGEVVLDGPDVDGRRFAISSEEDADGAKLVHAADGAGTISVTLMPGPCEDSMSGATFPLTGALTIDGIGPASGCARPAAMPAPRPAP